MNKKTGKPGGIAAYLPFVILILLPIALMASLTALTYSALTSADWKNLQDQQQSAVELALYRSSAELASAVSDIAYTTDQEELQNWFDQESDETRASIIEEYLDLMRRKVGFEQIRLLDEHGREVIRTDRVAGEQKIVPQDRLQDKSERYYVRDTLALDRDQVYVSAFDLNVEHGVIEQPIRPTIRFGMPVFDSQGRKRGAIVINYNGERLLAGIRALKSYSAGSFWLLNSRGDWLIGPNREDEWAFMYPDRSGRSFALTRPEAWKQLSGNRDHHQFSDNGELFTAARIFPDAGVEIGNNPSSQIGDIKTRESWIILAHVPVAVAAAVRRQHAFRLAIVFGAAALMQILAGLLVNRHWKARRIAEHAIRENEERFRVAFTEAPHGFGLTDLDGRWLKVNRALAEMMGYDEDELLQTNFQAITHPDDLESNLELRRQVLDGKMPSYQMEKRYIRKDGSTIPVLLSVSLVRDDQGKPAYFVAQLLDLTERNEIAGQLAQSQKMEAVGQLTGGIAHDFNNLLTVILGNARLLARRMKGNAATEKKLNAIAGAAERGASLTNRLLAFSRKEVLEPKLVDGGQLVTGMLDMMRRTLGETIGIRTNFANGPLNVLADPNLLEAALLNLANNARDAMPDGGTLSIHVGTSDGNGRETVHDTSDGPGGFIVFTVSDSGSGISAENLDHIFEPFFTTKEVGQGTGLGLSMVFGFVKQSGGRIEVDSQEGTGTTFRIFLPKSQGIAVDPEDAVFGDEMLTGGKGTILVVEDEPGVRNIAVDVLEELGYTVVHAGTGPEALIRLDELNHVDLLFTDIIMPGNMTGLELAVKARERIPDLKVLYTTGYARGVNFASPSLPDGLDILSKPYAVTELAERIRNSLRMAA